MSRNSDIKKLSRYAQKALRDFSTFKKSERKTEKLKTVYVNSLSRIPAEEADSFIRILKDVL